MELGEGSFKRAKRRPDYFRLEGKYSFSPEYKEKFVNFARQRPRVKRPLGQFPALGDDELQKISEIHAQYIRYLGARRSELLRRNTHLHLEGDFLGKLTEQREQFVPKEGRRSELQRRPTNLHMEGSFQKSTENNESYVVRPPQSKTEAARRQPNLIVHEGEMDFGTENAMQYTKRDQGPRQGKDTFIKFYQLNYTCTGHTNTMIF